MVDVRGGNGRESKDRKVIFLWGIIDRVVCMGIKCMFYKRGEGVRKKEGVVLWYLGRGYYG